MRADPAAKPLPPEAQALLRRLESDSPPFLFGNCVVVALDPELGARWPRFVLTGDPQAFDLSFVNGWSLLVVGRLGHDPQHVEAVAQALQDAGAREIGIAALPSLH